MKVLTKKSLDELAKVLPVVDRQEMQAYVGGDLFRLNGDGTVERIESRPDDVVDTLISQKTGAGGITLSPGILSGMLAGMATALVGNTADGKKLFEYCADNSWVEWGYGKNAQGEGIIWTNNNGSHVSLYPEITGVCSLVTHSHVGAGGGPSADDIEAAKKYPDVTFEIYCNGQYIRYNGNGIIK